MRFSGKRDFFYFYIWLAILIPYGGICAFIYSQEHDFTPIYILGGVWILLGLFMHFTVRSTHYTFIDDETLVCQTMYFFKKRITVQSIRKFEKSNGFYAGWKMSTSWDCLIIHYNKYEELLISPENEELFIAEVERRKALVNP
jgi:fatty acid desaturase